VQQIAAGKVITADMIAVKNLPVEAINTQAARSADEVVGRVSSADIEPDEQMLVSRFYRAGDADNNTLAYALQPGQRAVTVAVDPVSGVSGLVKPRDHVDVLAILTVKQWEIKPVVLDGKYLDDPGNLKFTIGDKIDVVYSLLPLQNVLVLATGQVLQANATDKDTTVEQITLSVTPEQAVLLNYVSSECKISLALRAPTDTAIHDVKPLTVDDILTAQDILAMIKKIPVPSEEPKATPDASSTPAPTAKK
jgi:pilus assembly protein CpaB